MWQQLSCPSGLPSAASLQGPHSSRACIRSRPVRQAITGRVARRQDTPQENSCHKDDAVTELSTLV